MRPRNDYELNLMRRSGKMTAKGLKKALEAVKVGVSLEEIEKVATEEILRLGGQPSFKTVPDYHWTTCLTINDEVVHGIPRPIILKEGDKVSIDIGAVYKGWHTDAAWSVIVGTDPSKEADKEKKKFLAVGEEALWKAVKQAKAGNRIGDISEAIQTTIEGAGYEVVRALVGHGVGRELHEDPEVPGFGTKGTGLKLLPGMTIAIEAIYTQGTKEVILAPDGWTISSADGSLGGLFEMSVIIRKGEPEVLTDWRKVE